MSNKDDKKILDEEKLKQKEDNKRRKDEERVERAKKIASRKESFLETYRAIEASIKRITSWFSQTIDKFLFSHKYDKIISVGIACILYMTINFSDQGIINYDSTYTIQSHAVTLNADLDVYEVTGYDKEVEVVLTGKATDITTARGQANTKIVLDLTGLQTGVHNVKFTSENFSSKVTVRTIPESATVTIRKKETARFKVTHDYLNLNKMDEKYYPGEPEFENTDVLVQASAKTIDEIAYVKALIDVKDATETFTTEAPLYAYNSEGQRMDVSIIPRIMKVTVPISSPSKTVKVTVVPEGIIPNNKSIESITLDHSSIELFGNLAVLEDTEEILVKIDATKLDRDMKLSQNISLPSGVRHGSVSTVNIDVKLADTQSKVLKGIPIAFENNVNGYKTRLNDPSQSTVDVTIFGSATILEQITEDNFGRVFFDMEKVSLGDVTLPLKVDTKHYLITYELDFNEIKMKVVDE